MDRLSEALRGMGAGLEQQVREWIEAERRSAVALALVRLRRRLQETRGRVLDLLAELEGAWVMARPDRERRIRSLVIEVDRIPAVIDSEAQHAFGLTPPAGPGPTRSHRRARSGAEPGVGDTTAGRVAAMCHIHATGRHTAPRIV